MKRQVILDEDDINQFHKDGNVLLWLYERIDKNALGLSEIQKHRIDGIIGKIRNL